MIITLFATDPIGNIAGTPGPGNTGSLSQIAGITGSGGYTDYPNADTDVNWQMNGSFSAVLPNCPPVKATGYVYPDGGTFSMICYTFD